MTSPPMCMCVVADSWCRNVASTAVRRSMCFWLTCGFLCPFGNADYRAREHGLVPRRAGGRRAAASGHHVRPVDAESYAITVWFNPSCSKCRPARDLLDERGAAAERLLELLDS